MRRMLSEFIEFQLVIIRVFQTHSDIFITMYLFMSFLADEIFLICFVPYIIWSVNYKKGISIAILVLICAAINATIKEIIQFPRPMYIDLNIVAKQIVSGYSFPSGHAQMAVVFWGVFASLYSKWRIYLITVLIMFCIGFSRVALAVHFPQDVIAGWIVGAIILLLYFRYVAAIENSITNMPRNVRLLFIIILPITLAIMFPTPDNIMLQGIFLGVWLGALFSKQEDYSLTNNQGMIIYAAGLIIVLALYIGLKLIPLWLIFSQESIWRFMRYFIVSIWVCYFARLWFNHHIFALDQAKE